METQDLQGTCWSGWVDTESPGRSQLPEPEGRGDDSQNAFTLLAAGKHPQTGESEDEGLTERKRRRTYCLPLLLILQDQRGKG